VSGLSLFGFGAMNSPTVVLPDAGDCAGHRVMLDGIADVNGNGGGRNRRTQRRRSETGARVIDEQRARDSPLCVSRLVQSVVGGLGNRSVCTGGVFFDLSSWPHPGTSSRTDTSMSAKSTIVIDSSGNSAQPSSISPDDENTTAPSTPLRHRIRK